jgi:DNA-binding PadR family transcriptional regulator
MRPSPNERVILAQLSAAGPSYGLQLVAASDGRLKRGGIYVTLGTMERKGLVTSEVQDDGRRVYQLSGLGHRALAAMEIIGAQSEALP